MVDPNDKDVCADCQQIVTLLARMANESATKVAASEALPVPLPLCWLCRTFLARAEAAIPKEKLAVAATQLCRVLPAVVAGACQCLAQRYAVLALEGVLGRLVPRLLCHTLLACRPEDGYPSLSPPRHPLGDTAAPPAGACAGTEALQHCQEHVWM
ncbi:pulmonary surfactant-associated protein B [Grus japonensis]|uniref:Pulmonary surfactant-associated protein B n=1 Tax=Grus japonensis TaxID=30415 RepID=A0ABC9XRK8_GRUJA